MQVSGQLYTQAVLPPRKDSGTHIIGGWMGPIEPIDISEMKKMFWFCRESKDGHSSPYPSHYSDYNTEINLYVLKIMKRFKRKDARVSKARTAAHLHNNGILSSESGMNCAEQWHSLGRR